MKQSDPNSLAEERAAKPARRKTRIATHGIPRSDAEAIKARNAKALSKPEAVPGRPKKAKKPKKGQGPMPDGYEPPRTTTPAKTVRPPSNHRETVLPLVDIGSRKFEEVCRDILKILFPEVKRAQLKRRNGQGQYGVDVEGFIAFNPDVVVSAKCYREVCAWDFTAWIRDFTEHLDGHWRGKGIRHFVLAVTHEMNDDDMNDGARALAAELAQHGIQFHLWNSVDITDALRSDSSLVDRYFNRYWVDAISVRHAPPLGETPSVTPLPRTNSTSAMGLVTDFVASFTAQAREDVEKLRAASLADAVKAHRAGRPSVLRQWLSDVRGDVDAWEALSPELRAKAIRASAILQLHGGDLLRSQEILDEADDLFEAPDRTARALVLREARGGEEAFALLVEPWTARERELAGALLIDLGREREALSALQALGGSDVTAEVLRLRAVARWRLGDYDAAMRDASFAVMRTPDEIVPRFTLATINVLSALVPGVHGQFGERPNPIDPGLLRDGKDARAFLDKAAAEFHHLASASEAPFREAAEAWELATLLLHPDRRKEGAELARVLIRREPPDPVVVAWALNYGLLRRRGRLKRTFHDALRSGRGTSTMAVVLARLLAGNDHPERGLALLKRYESLFDRDRSLLEAWSVQFGEPTSREDHPFADALRRERQDPASGALQQYLSSPSATVEEVLWGCEALAQRGAWTAVDGLRPKLVGVGNDHTLGLAAQAAFRTGDFDACLDLLRTAADRSESKQLPRQLVFLRSRANEAAGRHAASILDLHTARLAGDDDDVDLRLLEAYQRIGALSQFREVAERVLTSAKLDAKQALQVAYVLREAAPDTARRALEEATRDGVPPEVAGAVIGLASRLGVGRLQNEAMRLLVAAEPGAQSFRKIESVEALMALMEENSREYRDRIEVWLDGRTPAVVPFHSDPRDYAYLFIADEDGRRNRLGDPLPMLLRAGGLAGREVVGTGERPPLRMDLSALLLAAGLGLLPAVERGFAIQVPRSAPKALVELEAEYQAVDKDLVARCSGALAGGAGSIDVLDVLPSEAIPLGAKEDPSTLDASLFGELLRRAFQDGHLDRSEGERLLGGTLPDPADDRPGTVALEPHTFVVLAASKALDVIAKVTRLVMAKEDADRCRGDLAAALQADKVRFVVSELRSAVAAGLARDWTTSPWTESDLAFEGDEAPKPPHMRCLMEVIDAQGRTPTACWIEDRAMSRSGIADLVDVLDIVDNLHGRGFVDGNLRTSLRRRLRDMGYSYVAPDGTEILESLLAAPVDGCGVVQTPGLVALRVWAVKEFAKARHLDKVMAIDPQGAPCGEMRQALALDGLVRNTVAGVWSAPSRSRAEKVAYSEWAWTYLRPSGAPGWPDEVEPENRRQYLAMTIAHTLDLVLIDAVGQGGMTADDRQDLIHWFDARQMRPLFRGDAGMLSAVADILGPTLTDFLDQEPPLKDATPELLRRYSLLREAHVRDFFDLLPDDLAAEVGRRNGLAARLDAKTQLVLTFGADSEASLDRLSEAYLSCLSAADPARGEPLALMDGTSATLRITDRKKPSATIVVGDLSTDLPRSTCILLDADAAFRKSSLSGSANLTDPRGLLRAQHLEGIAELEPFAERMTAFEALRRSDYHHSSFRLGQRLRGSSTIVMAEFDPPGPDDMLAYMRLLAFGQEEASHAVSTGASAVVTELGPEEAMRRFAGMPVDLPMNLMVTVSQSMPKPVHEGNGKLLTPMAALLRLRGLIAADGDVDALSSGVLDLVAALDGAGPLFASLVRAGMKKAAGDDRWKVVPMPTTVCLVWVHADHVTRTCIEAGVDCGRFAVLLDGATRPDFRDVDEWRTLDPWVPRVTTRLTTELLDAILATRAIADLRAGQLSNEAVDALKALCGTVGQAGLTPRLDFVAPAPPGPDAVWIVRDVMTPWLTIGWSSTEHPFAERDCTALARRLLGLEQDPAHPYMLAVLMGAIDPSQVEPETLQDVWRVMAEADGEAALEPEYAGMLRVLSAYAVVLARLGRTETMVEVLRKQASRCRAKWPRARIRHRDADDDANRAFGILMASAFEHAMALARTRSERAGVYAEATAAIAEAWPASTEGVVSKLDDFVRQLSGSDAINIWPVLLKLRGTA